jgi:hypothetical protein
MNKRLLIGGIAVILAGLGVVAFLSLQNSSDSYRVSKEELAKQMAQYAAGAGLTNAPTQAMLAPLDMAQPVRLAVGGLGLTDNNQNQQLGDLVTAELTSAKGFSLVERQSLTAILRELNLSLSGFVRARDAVRVGKLLKVDWFLLGTEAKLNGTNALVIRVVDARTGIMRDAGVVSANQPASKMAVDVAAFVRQSRQNAALAKSRVYLAIGAFEDFSVNNRQADFPTQLRGYLIAAYQGGNVTLLEREYADTLLQELRLDLAGLTAGAAIPEPMQSAYWLVDGDYQSYETTNFEVEVTINVSRMFGRWSKEILHGPPDERLFQKIKGAIDAKMNKDTSAVAVSRTSEAHAQMSAGKELAGLGMSGLIFPDSYQELNEQETARQLRNASEAIRAFETVLLLEPTNREAKIYLAACLRKPTVHRLDEARNLYREILEQPMPDKWTGQAQQALVQSFRWSDPEEKARWFASAVQHNTNSALDAFYRQNAETASRDAVIDNREEKSAELAEKRLLEAIRSCKNFMDGKGGTFGGAYGLYDFQEAFQDKAAAARAMADLLPKMEAEFPELAPHLAAEVLSFQVETNSSALSEFEKTLDWCMAHPKAVFKPVNYWHESARSALDWVTKHQQFALAVKTMEGWRAAADQRVIEDFGSEDQIALGFAYMCAERWEAALNIFAGFSKMPVLMSTDGPWGNAWHPVLTSKEVDYCQKKLGLPIAHDPKEFDMGKDCFCMHTPSSFATGDDGVWIAIGDQLLHLDYDLKTNLVVKLPKDFAIPITTLDVGMTNIWIGTDGAGLVEFDKTTRKCQRMTVKDGLMMDEICSTLLLEDSLWLGYGHKNDPGRADGKPSGGGMGIFNFSTRQFASFTRSMTNGTDALKHTGGNLYLESANEPPRRAVTALAAGSSGDIWFLNPELTLQRFRSKDRVWEGLPQVTAGCCLATDATQIYAGQFRGLSGGIRTGPLGLNIYSFRDSQWRSFKAVEGLPSEAMSALAFDGRDLWAGGMGYIALLDTGQNQIRKLAYVRARSVDKIQIGGGYVWAQFDRHLYRAPLSALQ